MKAIIYKNFGGIDVLKLEEVPRPVPSTGQVLIRVKAVSINPGEASIREGHLVHLFPSTFPSGQGNDLAGVIEELGPDATGFNIGDEVLGFTFNRATQAEFVVTETDKRKNVEQAHMGGPA